MKIDIVIPNYNGSHLIKKNIPHVLKALKDFKDSSIIIVDDCSTEEDKRQLRLAIDSFNFSSKTPITLIEHKKNMGFSSAVNTGVKASRADLVVLLNSDVMPKEDFLLSPLEKFKNTPDLFAVGCMEESIEGDKTVLRGNGKGAWKRGLILHSKGDVKEEHTFWVSGGSGVFKRELYEKLGGMDKLYNPFYWEDIDLSYRAQKSGFTILFDNKSVIEHRHNEGAIKTHFKKNKINTTAYRNQFTFIWKNITEPTFLVSHSLWLPYHVLSAIARRDSAFLKGFIYAVLRLPDIISQRNAQKSLYKLSDREVLSLYK